MNKYIYYNEFPYNPKTYSKIAKKYIGDFVEKRNRKGYLARIKIEYIHKLSWSDLQLLEGIGRDRFTKMVNLYNKYAIKQGFKQIIEIGILKRFNLQPLKEHWINQLNRMEKSYEEFQMGGKIIQLEIKKEEWLINYINEWLPIVNEMLITNDKEKFLKLYFDYLENK